MLCRPLCAKGRALRSKGQLLNEQLHAFLLRKQERMRVVAQQILHTADHASLFDPRYLRPIGSNLGLN